MRYFCFIFLIGFGLAAQAQIGFLGTYHQLNVPFDTDNSTTGTTEFNYDFANTIGFGIGYFLRPIDYRIEILPRLSYLKTEDNNQVENSDYQLRVLDFSVPIQFY